MSLDEFNSRIRDIEVEHADFFKGRRIFSYYAVDPDRRTDKYIITFFENKPLPRLIEAEIAAAYHTHLMDKTK
jgi:hypothetical protein